MEVRINSADSLDLLLVGVHHVHDQMRKTDTWTLIYASGREEQTNDADKVQAVLQSAHQGNRRTLR